MNKHRRPWFLDSENLALFFSAQVKDSSNMTKSQAVPKAVEEVGYYPRLTPQLLWTNLGMTFDPVTVYAINHLLFVFVFKREMNVSWALF